MLLLCMSVRHRSCIRMNSLFRFNAERSDTLVHGLFMPESLSELENGRTVVQAQIRSGSITKMV